jgi:hypothetical protein
MIKIKIKGQEVKVQTNDEIEITSRSIGEESMWG